ncbi:MAG: SDR family NAD(P)-dependent oxidoreductase [Actinomycetota bacterium]
MAEPKPQPVTWKRALVTGASSGIGDAFARQLAAAGTDLVVVARDEQRLRALADDVDAHCEVLPADLGDTQQLARVADRISADDDPIDLVINNAGFGNVGPLAELDADDEAAVVAVNVTAVLRLSQTAAAVFANRATADAPGGILNVSSMAAFMATPQTATYNATKAFVNSLTEALHLEMRDEHVHVTVLCPGFTRTEFQDRAEYNASSIPDWLWQTADEVAAAGLAGVATNKAVVVSGAKNRVGSSVVNAMPGSLRRFVAARMPG